MRNLLDRWIDDPHKRASPNLATSQSKFVRTYSLNVMILALLPLEYGKFEGFLPQKTPL
jgi:hypothetical protein